MCKKDATKGGNMEKVSVTNNEYFSELSDILDNVEMSDITRAKTMSRIAKAVSQRDDVLMEHIEQGEEDYEIVFYITFANKEKLEVTIKTDLVPKVL